MSWNITDPLGVRGSLGDAASSIINTTGAGMPANQNAQGGQGGGATSVQDVTEYARQRGITLDPNKILSDQYQRNQTQDQATQNMQYQNAAFASGLGNSNANQTTQRSMAVAAQQNAAANVANQLNNLQRARESGAQAIASAMNAGMTGIR